ncbi:MAG: helix-turn-helix domain-containing protein [Candidatus Pacebacteria bacterium]|nr:helix-turn-helix domain-containing protein [Candidatus Paceibacterota bacterium]
MNKKKNNKKDNFYNDLKNKLKDDKFKELYCDSLLRFQIAAEIIAFRKKKKLSQKQLAEKINTTQAVISRIENGEVAVSTNILERICYQYNLRLKFKLYELA